MLKMKKAILFLILIIIFGGFFFWQELLDFYSKLFLKLPQEIQERIALIKEVEKQIAAPPPLRAKEEAPEPFLTQAGVINWTNLQREKYGLAPLKESAELNASALMKAKDMFAKQYFSHLSPSGEGVAELAEKAGYQFIAIAENLALGNFQDDEALVQGWMDSPGHRENILSSRYQEIGVAVFRGEFAELRSSHASAEASAFEEKTTWLAVQHFALPLSACPQPPEATLAQIKANEVRLKELEITLKEFQLEIKKIRPKWGPIYGQKVEQYNDLVSRYNELFSQTQDLINQYNNWVVLFNECAAGP